MLSRVLLSIGVVAASVGLTVFGMGTSYNPQREDIKDWGLWLMIGGAIVSVGAGFWYAAQERQGKAQQVPSYEETKSE